MIIRKEIVRHIYYLDGTETNRREVVRPIHFTKHKTYVRDRAGQQLIHRDNDGIWLAEYHARSIKVLKIL